MSFVKENFRCECPITSALDVLGDKWTLVIIKLMLLEQKKHLKNFQKAWSQLRQAFCLVG